MKYTSGDVVTIYSLNLSNIDGHFANSIMVRSSCNIMSNKAHILPLIVSWNVSFFVDNFYLPIVANVFIQNHLLDFSDKRAEVPSIIEMLELSYKSVQEIWRANVYNSNIKNIEPEFSQADAARVANEIRSQAHYLGLL